MAAVNLLQKKQQDQQNAQNGKVGALESEASELGGNGRPQTFARGATKESAGQSGLGSILGSLGSLKAGTAGPQPDMSTVKQANGVNADPLSYGSVNALQGIGVNGQNAPSDEDLLSDY